MDANKIEALRISQEYCSNAIDYLSGMMEQLVRLQQHINEMIIEEAKDERFEAEEEIKSVEDDVDKLLRSPPVEITHTPKEEVPVPKPKKKGLLAKIKGKTKNNKKDKSREDTKKAIEELEKELAELKK